MPKKDCPKNEQLAEKRSFEGYCSFWAQSFNLGHYPPIYQQAGKAFIFYNPPINSSRRMHLDRSCIFCGVFRVSWYGIVKQFFFLISWSLASAKRYFSFLGFHDQLKV